MLILPVFPLAACLVEIFDGLVSPMFLMFPPVQVVRFHPFSISQTSSVCPAAAPHLFAIVFFAAVARLPAKLNQLEQVDS